jgi:hypothetical protein
MGLNHHPPPIKPAEYRTDSFDFDQRTADRNEERRVWVDDEIIAGGLRRATNGLKQPRRAQIGGAQREGQQNRSPYPSNPRNTRQNRGR